MDLFAESEQKRLDAAAPLAVRMRPRNLDEFAGQQHFIGQGKLLWRMLQADRLTSLIFFGPPGTGKTALAHVIARQTAATFVPANAATIGVKHIRDVLAQAADRLRTSGRRTVLFLDEIHRFSRSQQDVLLDDVERGVIILVGATTENPYFAVNSALVSRSTVFEFFPLEIEDVRLLLQRAAADHERGLGKYRLELTDEAADYLATMSDGDARRALTALEIGAVSQARADQAETILFDKALAEESIQRKALVADRTGDTHYDLASALQKSMRGSDPDATVYWLARLIVGGEDPRFIARRIAVCAAEDVGNADPTATILAVAAVQISEFVGFPEAQLHLAQAAIYVACAPKSNASAAAIWKASADVKQGRTVPVPAHLRDAHYKGAKELGRGLDYKYPHSHPEGFVPQNYLPPEAARQYYQPTNRGREKQFAQYLDRLRELTERMRTGQQPPQPQDRTSD